MKQQGIIIASAFLLIACQGLMAQSGKASTQRFDDGIYGTSETVTVPSPTSQSPSVSEYVPTNLSASQLVSKTTNSGMYVNPALTDTLAVPDPGTFSKKVRSFNVNDTTYLMPVDSSLLYSMVPQKDRTAITINSTWSVNFGLGPFWGRPWYYGYWAWDPWYRPWGPWDPWRPYDPWYRPWPYHPYGPYHPYYPVTPGRVVRYIDSNSPNSFASGIGTQSGHRRSGDVVRAGNSGVVTSRTEVTHAPRSSYNTGSVPVRSVRDMHSRTAASGAAAPTSTGRRYSNNGYNVAIGGSSGSSGSSAPSYRRPSGGSSGSGSYSRSYSGISRSSGSSYSRSSSSSSNYSSGSNNYSGGSRSSGSSYSGGGYSGGGGGGGGGGSYSGGGGGGFSGGGSGHRR